ncbi:3483_t:CDS:2, partial [Cetraspora pellucida]
MERIKRLFIDEGRVCSKLRKIKTTRRKSTSKYLFYFIIILIITICTQGEERTQVDDLRGSPMGVGSLEEIIDDYLAMSVVGILQDDTDPMVSVMKLEKAPTESYADIGGLEQQIQGIKESVELLLTHPELYEEMGLNLRKVLSYMGKPLLAKAVANQTSAIFLRVMGSELIQKYLGDGLKLVLELFRVADEHAPSI